MLARQKLSAWHHSITCRISDGDRPSMRTSRSSSLHHFTRPGGEPSGTLACALLISISRRKSAASSYSTVSSPKTGPGGVAGDV